MYSRIKEIYYVQVIQGNLQIQKDDSQLTGNLHNTDD